MVAENSCKRQTLLLAMPELKLRQKSFVTLVPVGGDLLEIEVDKGLDSQRFGAVAGDNGVVLKSI
jgi:hypothetical protein